MFPIEFVLRIFSYLQQSDDPKAALSMLRQLPRLFRDRLVSAHTKSNVAKSFQHSKTESLDFHRSELFQSIAEAPNREQMLLQGWWRVYLNLIYRIHAFPLTRHLSSSYQYRALLLHHTSTKRHFKRGPGPFCLLFNRQAEEGCGFAFQIDFMTQKAYPCLKVFV